MVIAKIRRHGRMSLPPGKRWRGPFPMTLAEGLEAYQFVFESPRIRLRSEFAAYAQQSFTPGRPLTEGLLDLTARIHRISVSTPRQLTFARLPKRSSQTPWCLSGFAHVQIACLRSLNLAARYVSGYLRTYPAPGKQRLVGVTRRTLGLCILSGQRLA